MSLRHIALELYLQYTAPEEVNVSEQFMYGCTILVRAMRQGNTFVFFEPFAYMSSRTFSWRSKKIFGKDVSIVTGWECTGITSCLVGKVPQKRLSVNDVQSNRSTASFSTSMNHAHA